MGARSTEAETVSTPMKSRPYATYTFIIFYAILTWLVYRSYVQDQMHSGSWGCEMSWMTPSYIRLAWPEAPSKKYSIYLYREQGWDTEERLKGHPVIFIPGNAGSYQQVRSIASSASRQFHEHPGGRADDMQDAKSLDFFAIDFTGAFSFHAATLREQSLYLKQAVSRVLDEYNHLPEESRPERVTLLGHSMGGIVARLALTFEIDKLVDVVLTLSSPHLLPPLTFEHDMEAIYRRITYQHNASSPLLLSLCGGVSDTQIVSDMCALTQELVSVDDGFAVFTTGVPGVWTGVDHQAMMWCHQVRWRLARVLLEFTRVESRQEQLAIAERWLLGRSEGRISPDPAEVIEVPVTSTNMTALLLPKPSSFVPRDPAAHIQWCPSKDTCRDLVMEITTFPWVSDDEAPFPLPGEGIRSNELAFAVNLQLPSSTGTLQIHVSQGDGIIVGPRVFGSARSNTWVSHAMSPIPVRLALHFPGIAANSLCVYRLDVITARCDGHRPLVKYQNRQTHSLQSTTHESRFFPVSSSPIFLHSHSGNAPFLRRQHEPSGADIDLLQTADCPTTSIRLSFDLWASLGKVVIRYRMTLVAWSLGWASLLLYEQLSVLDRSNHLPSLDEAIEGVARRSLTYTTGLMVIAGTLQAVLDPLIPTEKLLLGTTQFFAIPLVAIMTIWTFGIVAVTSIVVSLVFRTSRQTYLALSWPRKQSDAASLSYTSIASAAVLLLLVFILIPRQVAFVILVLIQSASLATSDLESPRANLLFSIFVFLLFLLPFNVTIIAVWGRNLWADWRHPFTTTDHDVLPLLPVLAVVQLGWSGNPPRNRKLFNRLARLFILAFAISAFLFGSRWTFILPWMANVVLIREIPVSLNKRFPVTGYDHDGGATTV